MTGVRTADAVGALGIIAALLIGAVVIVYLVTQRGDYYADCRALGGHVVEQGHSYRASRLCVSPDGRIVEVP